MARQCADILRYGIKAIDPKYDADDPTGGGLSEGGIYQADKAVARMANHILGGARFGTSPKDSVLDLNNRAWEFDNLFVTDGSFMPTSGGSNPTLTIQANALRVADHLLSAGLV
jgi:choline dehydrogenase-like flavoprotein